MDDAQKASVLAVIRRMPQWIRHDLQTKDAAVRSRAEESLAAIIAGALEDDGSVLRR
jgi:hypothetical protein